MTNPNGMPVEKTDMEKRLQMRERELRASVDRLSRQPKPRKENDNG